MQRCRRRFSGLTTEPPVVVLWGSIAVIIAFVERAVLALLAAGPRGPRQQEVRGINGVRPSSAIAVDLVLVDAVPCEDAEG